ncbi:MAG TPA: Crp/Fnr family transcriptional regulator [Puia sp.]|jgi:CRP-like cAMP-binding protein
MQQLLRDYINRVTSSIMPDEEYKFLVDAFSLKLVRKKKFLLHEGSICTYMAFIARGAMKQYFTDEKGIEHIVRFGIEGWWMSDRESFVSLTPSRYTIEAVEDCDLLVTTPEKMAQLKKNSPSFVKLGQILDERSYIASQKRIEATISYTAGEKVIYLMESNPEFLHRFPQNMLASYLGLSPETLSRVRKQLLSK